jgi:hypothetical protein
MRLLRISARGCILAIRRQGVRPAKQKDGTARCSGASVYAGITCPHEPLQMTALEKNHGMSTLQSGRKYNTESLYLRSNPS